MKSETLRFNVLKLKGKGKSYSEIANILNISRNQVVNMCQYDLKIMKKKRGPQFKLKKYDKLKIKRKISIFENNQERINSNKIKKQCCLDVSVRTIQRHMKRCEMKYKNVRKQILLTNSDKFTRLETVRLWIGNNHPWEKTIFTDEKRFSLDGPDDWRSYVRNNFSSSRIKRQCGGGGVMVWMMVMPNGLLSFHFLEGKVDSKMYIDLMKIHVLPTLFLNYGLDFYLQQDNAPVHRSKLTMDFFKSSGIKVLPWPPRSPDMNIVEDMWKVLSDSIYDGPSFQTRDELRLSIKNEIDNFNKERRHIVQNLYKDFRNRLCVVLEKKGCLYNK